MALKTTYSGLSINNDGLFVNTHRDLTFSYLIQSHQPRLFGTIYAMVGNKDDAEDIVQEAILRAYRAFSQFCGRAKFETWLYRIGVNCCWDWIRRTKRHRTDAVEFCENRDVCDFHGHLSESSDSQILRQDLNDAIDEALQTLSPILRLAFVLREVKGLTYRDIAGLMACSEGTVKSRIFRARLQLQKILKSEYGDCVLN